MPILGTNTFTTKLSPDEVRSILRSLLNARIKFLIISYAKLTGAVAGNAFTFRQHRTFGESVSPRVQGEIIQDDRTLVKLNFRVPYLYFVFYLLFALIMISAIWLLGPMNINGVRRVPELYEKIGFSFMAIVAPAFFFIVGVFWPLKRIEAMLSRALKLEKIRASSQ